MPPPAVKSDEPASLTQAILGKQFPNWTLWGRAKTWPDELRAALVVTLVAALMFIPFVGAVGLWDPWETHYGEVAREMIQRNDYVHTYWENAYFFSKPVFAMWMMAVGMHAGAVGRPLMLGLGLVLAALGVALYTGRLRRRSSFSEFWGVILAVMGATFLVGWVASLGVNLPWKFGTLTASDGAMPLYTEWGFRLPTVLFAILALGMLTYAVTIASNLRAGLATGFVLMTMPLYFLLARQSITDPPFVCSLICGMACAMVALFDDKSRFQTQWWFATYVFFAFATLAKGLLGFGIPMVIALLYAAIAVVDWSAASMRAHLAWLRTHLLRAAAPGLVAGVIAGVVAAMVGARLHTTFMEVPPGLPMDWLTAPVTLGIVWGSLAFWIATTIALSRRPVTETPPTLFAFAYQMRLGVGILLFLAVALPWYYEMFTFWRLDDESKLFWFRFLIYDHFARLGAGVHTTTPGGDFTYFITQGGYAIYPWVVLLPGAIVTLARTKFRGGTRTDKLQLIAGLWLAVCWTLIGSSATKFHHYVFPMLPPLALAMGLFLDKLWEDGIAAHAMELLLGIPFFMLVGKDLAGTPKDFTDLFVYNYDRAYPVDEVDTRFNVGGTLRAGAAIVGGLALVFALARNKVRLFAVGLAGALAFGLWFNWVHWVHLTHHWTQRDQFWRYYSQRKSDEPIASFLMNWRGETFYSRNTVKQIRDGNTSVGMARYAALPGRKWALVEHYRLNILRAAVGANHPIRLIDRDLNVKFVLVTID